MINAKDKKEFLNVLRVISEEAVKLSKKSLNESSDPYAKKYAEQFSNDQKRYGSLSEQDDDAAAEDELEDLEAAAEEVPDEDVELEDEPEPESDDPPPEDDTASGTSTEEFGVSFDSVLDAINNLRAGKSLKDTNIKDQTSAYYDRLDDPERKVLLVFLKQLAGILGGALDGSSATDPSDLNLTVTDGGADEDEGDAEPQAEEEVITDEPSDEPAAAEDLPPDEGEDESPEEDTSPPIRVNESQDMEDLRRRVRRLMLKG